MSHAYTSDVANAQTKCISRAKIAHNIQDNTPRKLNRVIHYLGGTSHRSPFEMFFPKNKSSFFVRYERKLCDSIPRGYVEAIWNEDGLMPKEEKDRGYFINSDFFHNCDDILSEFPDHVHDMWLDFCGMPTDDLLFQLDKKVFNGIHSDKIRLVYITFYLNHRGFPLVQHKLNKYGKSLSDRAKSLCEFITEKYLGGTGFSCEVFDTYNNDVSPMGVIKLTKQIEKPMKKTKTKNREHNTDNYLALRLANYSDDQIQSMWNVSKQTIAAFKAWNTMRCEIKI